MPKPGEGTENIRLYHSQESPEMRQTIAPMPFSAFASHLQGVKVMFSSNQYFEMHGQINHLIGSLATEKTSWMSESRLPHGRQTHRNPAHAGRHGARQDAGTSQWPPFLSTTTTLDTIYPDYSYLCCIKYVNYELT